MKFDVEICKGVSCPECSFNKGEDGCLLAKRLDEIEIIPEPCEEAQHILDYLDNVLHPLVSPEHWNAYSELYDMIAALPSAQPKIVRCKDCKWFENIGCAISIADDSDKPTENDFCSFAERRTDG